MQSNNSNRARLPPLNNEAINLGSNEAIPRRAINRRKKKGRREKNLTHLKKR